LHGVGKDRIGNILKHLKENGFCVRIKKSGGRKSNTRAIHFATTIKVISFLSNVAEEHGYKLPGCVPGFRNYNLSLLPSEMTKESVYARYKAASSESDVVVGLSTFKNL
jgi:hypothetical protein